MTHRRQIALLAAICLGLTGGIPKLPKVLKQPQQPQQPKQQQPKPQQQQDQPKQPPGPPSAAVLHHLQAAAALVVVDKATSASAFCINPAGLFVTHRKVIDAAKVAAGGTVTLVVEPGQAAQRQVPAKVIRLTESVALLQADDDGSQGPAPFHALPLSGANGPGRDTLWAVTTGGFPTMAVAKDTTVPAPTTTTMWCWARYKPAGHWHSVHLETAVTAGTTGGPVVGGEGRVVGVCDEPDSAGQIKVAAPAADVYMLAETPVISVRVGAADATGKRTLTAAVFSALGKLKDATATLQLGTGPTAVTVPLPEVAAGAFSTAAAVPPASDGKPVRYRVTVKAGTSDVGQTDGKVDGAPAAKTDHPT